MGHVGDLSFLVYQWEKKPSEVKIMLTSFDREVFH